MFFSGTILKFLPNKNRPVKILIDMKCIASNNNTEKKKILFFQVIAIPNL